VGSARTSEAQYHLKLDTVGISQYTIQMKKTPAPYSGLSLVEVLGAICVLAVAATVSLFSVKESLQAGQRSAIQRELQTINSALSGFKAAGGTIADNSSAMDAIRQMRTGGSGFDYSPLIQDPEETKALGGQTYRLAYDDTTGFSYVPDDPQEVSFGDSGSEITPKEASAYAFDPSSQAAIALALQALSSLHPEDPAYSAALDALNAAFQLGNVTEEELLQAGLVLANGTWMRPIFDINDPVAALNVAQSLGSYRNDVYEYTARIASINAALAALPPADQVSLNTSLVGEFMDIAVNNRPDAASLADWSKLNLAQGLLDRYGISYLFQKNLSGLNVTGGQFNGLSAVITSDLSGLDLAGIDLSQMYLLGANLTNATGITGSDLNGPGVLAATLTNIDLTGYDATGKKIWNLNFTNTNLTIDMIKDAQKTDLYSVFTGTGITPQDLLDAGWTQEQLVNARF